MKRTRNIKIIIQITCVLMLLLLLLGYGYKRTRMQEQISAVMEQDVRCTVKNPRVNFVHSPVGVDEERIYFSWEPEKDQKAYEIIVREYGKGEEVWNSGIVTSDQTMHIPYEGSPLLDCTKYVYRIFVFDTAGNVFQSPESFFETAYIEGKPFHGASMISMHPEENIYEGGQAVYFKKFDTQTGKKLQKAVYYGSALGVYDAYINGYRIGEDEWKPGWTDYTDTLLYNTYDITECIEESGINRIAVMAGTGWWCGRNGLGTYGYRQPAIICQIILFYTDGSRQTINSGEDWEYYKDTAVQAADFYNGETYDASKVTTKQISLGTELPREGIKNVCISNEFAGEYKSFYGYNVSHLPGRDCSVVSADIYDSSWEKTKAEWELPITIKAGETLIVDLGQNMTGVPYLVYDAEEGTEIDIQFAEMLNDSGEKERGNDGPKGSLYRTNYRSAQTTVRLLAGSGCDGEKENKETIPQEYSPAFFYCGFRYLSLTASRDITLYDLKGRFVGNKAPEVGELKTDNAELNQLISNVLWSQYNNFSLVATDCPQRDERIGWTGDLLAFAGTSLYNQDLYSFYKKWQEDLKDAQTQEGAFTDTVPATAGTSAGNAGWADAGIMVPLEVYRKYGDKELLTEIYPSMKKYMKYLEGISSYVSEDIRMGAAPTFGDWLSYQQADANLLSALWYLADATAMEEIADILGKINDEREYRKIGDQINAYVLETYKDKFDSVSFSQTELLFLLNYLRIDEKKKEPLKEALKQNLEENNYRVMTGFVGTPLLLETLTSCGMEQEAYGVLFGEENPSWLYSVKQGATTIWERWDAYTKENGFEKSTMNSFNHFTYGSVARWMYERMLGIRVDMTKEQPILIAPVIPGDEFDLNEVSGSYQSVYGDIRLAWEKRPEGKIKISLELPYNTEARVSLPIEGMKECVLPGGTYEWEGKLTIYLE